MYNRYVPQPDGTYCRNRVPDQVRCNRPERPPAPPCPSPEPPAPPPIPHGPVCKPQPPKNPPCKANQSAGNFLKNLLPKNLDTGDLVVILLLLLLAGDCEEDKNTAMLTLMLYLFM